MACRMVFERNARQLRQREAGQLDGEKLHLPFIIVKTKPSTKIDCEVGDVCVCECECLTFCWFGGLPGSFSIPIPPWYPRVFSAH